MQVRRRRLGQAETVPPAAFPQSQEQQNLLPAGLRPPRSPHPPRNPLTQRERGQLAGRLQRDDIPPAAESERDRLQGSRGQHAGGGKCLGVYFEYRKLAAGLAGRRPLVEERTGTGQNQLFLRRRQAQHENQEELARFRSRSQLRPFLPLSTPPPNPRTQLPDPAQVRNQQFGLRILVGPDKDLQEDAEAVVTALFIYYISLHDHLYSLKH